MTERQREIYKIIADDLEINLGKITPLDLERGVPERFASVGGVLISASAFMPDPATVEFDTDGYVVRYCLKRDTRTALTAYADTLENAFLALLRNALVMRNKAFKEARHMYGIKLVA